MANGGIESSAADACAVRGDIRVCATRGAPARRKRGRGDDSASSDALTRFANNAIHQNVAERGRLVSVRVVVDRRTARVASNRLDATPSPSARTAMAIARLLKRDPDVLPLAEAANVKPHGRSFTLRRRAVA